MLKLSIGKLLLSVPHLQPTLRDYSISVVYAPACPIRDAAVYDKQWYVLGDQVIDPNKMEAAITPRTKCIMPVQWPGM